MFQHPVTGPQFTTSRYSVDCVILGFPPHFGFNQAGLGNIKVWWHLQCIIYSVLLLEVKMFRVNCATVVGQLDDRQRYTNLIWIRKHARSWKKSAWYTRVVNGKYFDMSSSTLHKHPGGIRRISPSIYKLKPEANAPANAIGIGIWNTVWKQLQVFHC